MLPGALGYKLKQSSSVERNAELQPRLASEDGQDRRVFRGRRVSHHRKFGITPRCPALLVACYANGTLGELTDGRIRHYTVQVTVSFRGIARPGWHAAFGISSAGPPLLQRSLAPNRAVEFPCLAPRPGSTDRRRELARWPTLAPPNSDFGTDDPGRIARMKCLWMVFSFCCA